MTERPPTTTTPTPGVRRLRRAAAREPDRSRAPAPPRPARRRAARRARRRSRWPATSIYRVQPDEQGVVLRFGKWVDTTQPGLHFHLPYPIETVLLPKVTQINQVQLGDADGARRRPARRGARAADADRRRKHRRGRLRGVLEDPRRRRIPVPRQRARGGGEDRGGRRAARGHQPHADPGGDVGQARSRSPTRRSDLLQSLLDSEQRGHRDHPGAVAARRAAAGGDRRLQRRAARPRRPGARAQRGAGLRQRHSAARARRSRAHPPGRRSLQDPGRQPRPRRGQRLPVASTTAIRPPRTSPPGASISKASTTC